MTKEYQVIITPKAEDDLRTQTAHIDLGSPSAAQKWKTSIYQTIKKLSHFPESHPLAYEFGNGITDLRRATYGQKNKWMIYFTIANKTVFVLHVKHQRQNRRDITKL